MDAAIVLVKGARPIKLKIKIKFGANLVIRIQECLENHLFSLKSVPAPTQSETLCLTTFFTID